MARTYDNIQTITPTTSPTSVSFTSISQTYQDLRLICFVVPSSNMDVRLRFNTNNFSDYAYNYLGGNGTSLSQNVSGTATSFTYTNVGLTNGESTAEIDFFQYTNNGIEKPFMYQFYGARTGSGGTAEFGNGLHNLGNAISTIEVYSTIGTFLTGTRFTLYGIKEA